VRTTEIHRRGDNFGDHTTKYLQLVYNRIDRCCTVRSAGEYNTMGVCMRNVVSKVWVIGWLLVISILLFGVDGFQYGYGLAGLSQPSNRLFSRISHKHTARMHHHHVSKLRILSSQGDSAGAGGSGNINMDLVKTLRERTGAGFTTCKQALIDCNGDITAAIDYMRKKGTAIALKKEVRSTNCGLIGCAISDDRKCAGIVEMNSETDFVTRNDIFLELIGVAAKAIASNPMNGAGGVTVDWASKLPADTSGSKETIHDRVVHAISTVGENIVMNRPAQIRVSSGIVAAYVHNAIRSDVAGKIGVVLGLQSESSNLEQSKLDELSVIGRALCLHIAAQSPEVLTTDQVSPEAIEKEKAIIQHQATEAKINEKKMPFYVEGKLKKYYEQVCLMEQKLDMDNSKTVRKYLQEIGTKMGSPIHVTSFYRYVVGE
jgi:elongation factor Ts